MNPYHTLEDEDDYFTFGYTRPPLQHIQPQPSPIVLVSPGSPFLGTLQSSFHTPTAWNPSALSDHGDSAAPSGYTSPAEQVQTSSDETSDILRDFLGQDNPRPTLPINRHRLLIQNCPDPLIVLTLGGTIVLASPSCQQTLGYQKDEIEGLPLFSFCHPSDVPMVTRELKSAIASASQFDIMLRMRRKLQGYVWLEMSGSVENGRDKGATNEQQVRSGRRRRSYLVLTGRTWSWPVLDRGLLESKTASSITDRSLWLKLSAHGLILHAPAKCQQLLGRAPETLSCYSILDLVPDESRHRVRQLIDVAGTGRTASCAHHFQVLGNNAAMVQTTLAPADAIHPTRPVFLLSHSKFLTRNASALNLGVQIESPPILASSSSSFVPSQQPDRSRNLFADLDPNSDKLWLRTIHEARVENERLTAELRRLSDSRRRRKRAMSRGNPTGTCANCRTRETAEWRRGPSGNMDLCNSCGLRWAKSVGGVSLYHKRPKTPAEGPAKEPPPA